MILSDRDLKQLIIQDLKEVKQAKDWWKRSEWEKIKNKILIVPFNVYALGPCCYDLSVGEEYLSLRDPDNPKPLALGDHFRIGPGETVLILSKEYICLPRNILAMVVPRATWIFEGSCLNATRVDPTWYGKLLIGFTNLAKNPIGLEYGEEFCTCYFVETKETEKILTPDIVKSLGREKIGSVKFTHAKQQVPLLPDEVTREHMNKVVELYGWPWDVVRGMLELTRKDIGQWIEKEVTSEIVDLATSEAERRAFSELRTLYKEQNNLLKALVIGVLTIFGSALIAYLINLFN